MEQQQEESIPGANSCQVAMEQHVREVLSSTVGCCRGHMGKGQVEKWKVRIKSISGGLVLEKWKDRQREGLGWEEAQSNLEGSRDLTVKRIWGDLKLNLQKVAPGGHQGLDSHAVQPKSGTKLRCHRADVVEPVSPFPRVSIQCLATW